MTREEAEEYAKTMSFRQAVYNAMQGKSVPYRKATAIKLRELLGLVDRIEVSEQEPKIGHWIEHPKGIYAHLVCDNCLSRAPLDYPTNYCPICGLKMDVSKYKRGVI